MQLPKMVVWMGLLAGYAIGTLVQWSANMRQSTPAEDAPEKLNVAGTKVSV